MFSRPSHSQGLPWAQRAYVRSCAAARTRPARHFYWLARGGAGGVAPGRAQSRVGRPRTRRGLLCREAGRGGARAGARVPYAPPAARWCPWSAARSAVRARTCADCASRAPPPCGPNYGTVTAPRAAHGAPAAPPLNRPCARCVLTSQPGATPRPRKPQARHAPLKPPLPATPATMLAAQKPACECAGAVLPLATQGWGASRRVARPSRVCPARRPGRRPPPPGRPQRDSPAPHTHLCSQAPAAWPCAPGRGAP